jgi:murein DD-endopeptidase MepM/ murein hydrolase activator NlpD
MKYGVNILVIAALGLGACAVRGTPAPVTGWDDESQPGSAIATRVSGQPHPDRIRVAHGDSLYTIAHRYGVPLQRLIEINHLAPPYRLEAGQTILLEPTAEQRRVAAAPPPQSEQPAIHVAYARTGGPRIDSDEVPPPEKPTNIPAASEGDRMPERTAEVREAATPTPAPAPAKGSEKFLWPVEGRVIASYGTAENGMRNDGINIAARAGSPVHAAAAGTVVYAGNEIRGYGNLVLLKHQGGYLTAYAHNAEILVHKGDRVARGQTIARVGSTGGVSEPQLHFEIRNGRDAIDPTPLLLPMQQADAKG